MVFILCIFLLMFKNLKYAFAAVAALFFSFSGVFAYSQDQLQSAYSRLYSNGVTSMSSIYSFRPNDTMLREEGAAFMVKFDQRMLSSRTTSYNNSCYFSDLYRADPNMQSIITQSCQYGIFAGASNTNMFYPLNTMTMCEALTVVDKMLNGQVYSTYNGYGDRCQQYYQDALSRGYLTNLDIAYNYNLGSRPVTRGEMALMLCNASGGLGGGCSTLSNNYCYTSTTNTNGGYYDAYGNYVYNNNTNYNNTTNGGYYDSYGNYIYNNNTTNTNNGGYYDAYGNYVYNNNTNYNNTTNGGYYDSYGNYVPYNSSSNYNNNNYTNCSNNGYSTAATDMRVSTNDTTPATSQWADITTVVIGSNGYTVTNYQGRVYYTVEQYYNGAWRTADTSAYQRRGATDYQFSISDKGQITMSNVIMFSQTGLFRVKARDNTNYGIYNYVNFNVGGSNGNGVSCSLPWGGTIADGQTVTAYQSSSASYCYAQVRTCSNGVLNGSYSYQTCNGNGNTTASSFTVTASNSYPTLNQSINFTIQALTSNGATNPSYIGTTYMTVQKLVSNTWIAATSSDYYADYTTATFAASNNGYVNFYPNLYFKQAGTYKILVTDSYNSSIVGSTTITVAGGTTNNATNYQLSISPSNPTVNSVATLSINVVDANGYTLTNYNNTIMLYFEKRNGSMWVAQDTPEDSIARLGQNLPFVLGGFLSFPSSGQYRVRAVEYGNTAISTEKDITIN